MDAVFRMFEDTVAETMTAYIRCDAPARMRCGRPDQSCFFVAEIKRFAGWVADRIVIPWCEAVFACIFAPGGSRSAFGNDRSEMGIRDDIHPGQGCLFCRVRGDDIFPPVGGKTSETV